jgi:Ca-activated chloride channel family protein
MQARELGVGVASVVLLMVLQVQAGVIVLHGAITNASGVAVRAARPAVTIQYSASDVKLDGEHASLRLDEDLVVEAAAEGGPLLALLPMPKGTDMASVAWTFGKGITQGGDPLRLTAEGARGLLRHVTEVLQEDMLMLHRGEPFVVIPLAVAEGTTRMRLSVTYGMKVSSDEGVARLLCPVPEVALSSGPVGRMVVSGSISNSTPVRAVFSPSHTCKVKPTGAHGATFRYVADHVVGTPPFELLVVTDEASFGWRTFAHRPEAGCEGTFALIGCPTGDGVAATDVAREVVFAVDVSGSMRGEKMAQARAALEYCLDQLSAQDHFNIVAFSDEVTSFRAGPVAADAAAVRLAREFVDELQPGGRTNIDEALAACVRGEAAEGRSRVVLFLTDGTPTAGKRNPDVILGRVKELNTAEARVFVVGIGHEVNTYLLDRVALETDGDSEYVSSNGALDEQVAALYARLAHPVLLGAMADFKGLAVRGVVPARMGDIYEGSLVVLAGRYNAACTGEVTIVGHLGDAERTLRIPLELPAVTGSTDAFVAPMWASRRMGECLEQMRLDDSDETLAEVVGLSRSYGIVTEYTASLDTAAAAEMSDEEVVTAAREQLRRARSVNSGKWAVMQSLNDKALKQRVAVNAQENSFVDAQGEVQAAANVRQLNGSAFYEQDGKWVQADDGRERGTRRVKRFSEEYFKLAEESDDFSRAASLEGEVILNMGKDQVHVY